MAGDKFANIAHEVVRRLCTPDVAAVPILVYSYIKSHHSDEKRRAVPYELIMNELNIGRTQLAASLTKLEALGVMKRHKRHSTQSKHMVNEFEMLEVESNSDDFYKGKHLWAKIWREEIRSLARIPGLTPLAAKLVLLVNANHGKSLLFDKYRKIMQYEGHSSGSRLQVALDSLKNDYEIEIKMTWKGILRTEASK